MMEVNEQQWYEAFLRGSDQDCVFSENEDDAFQETDRSANSTLPTEFHGTGLPVNKFEMLDLPPSLRDAAENPQFNTSYQHIAALSILVDDELDNVTATAPLSFYQRSIQSARPQMHGHFESVTDVQCVGFPSSQRVDSVVGSLDDLPSIPDIQDQPGLRLDESRLIQGEEYNCQQGPLQYHLIQPRTGVDYGEIATHLFAPRAIPPVPVSPSSRGNNLSLPCPLCVDKRFTGVWAHRNLTRHLDSVHAPCSSPDGVKHFRCGHEDCDRTFRREDARLVHERRSHPDLNRPPPTKRKRSGEL